MLESADGEMFTQTGFRFNQPLEGVLTHSKVGEVSPCKFGLEGGQCPNVWVGIVLNTYLTTLYCYLNVSIPVYSFYHCLFRPQWNTRTGVLWQL